MLSIIGITPHPPIIIPAIGRDNLGKAQKTVDGMKQLSNMIRREEPELLIVITPHGKIAREGPAVMTHERLKGDFGRFGHPQVEIEMKSDAQLIDLLVEEASSEPVKPALLGDSDRGIRADADLDHGAMVPIYYLQEAGIDIPGVHITIGFQSYETLYLFGKILRRAVDRRGAPAAVIASGDLSHRLTPDAPAGYNPGGIEFDRQLVEYLKEGRVEDILNFDQRLVEEAGECGLRSFIIALGMLDGKGFKPEIISYEGPFGVGYLVAAFHPGR